MKSISLIIPLGLDKEPEFIDAIKKDKRIKIIIQKGNNPSKNRNQGVKKSRTDYVAFINGHTLIEPNWFDEVSKFASNHPEIDVFGGPQLNYEGDNYFAKSSGFAMQSIFGSASVRKRYMGNKLKFNADELDITSANLICKRNVFSKVKFDETIYPGEDPKFIRDSKKTGLNVAFSPEIKAYNKRRENIPTLSGQIFTYGVVRPKNDGIFQSPFFLVPSIFLIYLLFLPTFLAISRAFFLPVIVYVILNVFFSFYEGIANKKPLFIPFISLAFIIIHISYGAGYLYGVLKRIMNSSGRYKSI